MQWLFKIMLKILNNFKFLFLVLLLIFSFFAFANYSRANLIDDLKNSISDTLQKKQQIEEEIKKTEAALNKTSGEKQSLQKDLADLNAAKKKLEGSIKKTEISIVATNGNIKTLNEEITDKENEIARNMGALAEVLRNIQNSNDDSAIERVLAGESISDYLETSENFADTINTATKELRELELALKQKKEKAESKKKELSLLKNDLSGQKQAVVQTEKTKDTLLSVTKNKEAEYKKLLAEKTALREQFEKDLFDYESKLQIAIDPSKLPTAKRGVLSWPLDKVVITQLFGATSAAKRLYVSGTHNGVDFGVPDGTPIKSVLSGTVEATGNTDTVKSCLSYGKWILVKHSNGLSSLYGHLSSISVSSGAEVETGQIIGYSGRTGYATGPHLHLTILATEGVRVGKIPDEKTVNCRGITIPLADVKAFLDPMLYLPK